MQQPNEWTLSEAAAYNGVSVRTIRRWIHDGHIAARLEPNLTGRPTQYVNAKAAAETGGRMKRHAENTRYAPAVE